MGVSSRWLVMLLAGAWLIANAGAASAQGADAAGRFIAVVGDVRIIGRDGTARAAQRGGEFYEGESIGTGMGALAQLRMSDGALMSVRAETQLKLDSYAYTGKDNRSAGFFLSIVRGGLRTLTGMISQVNRERYRITTETATVGIRGTDFELVHVPQEAGSKEVPAGTYNRVYDGVTSLQNKLGVTLLVSRDQTGFAELQGTTPPVHVVPPPALFGRATPLPPGAPQSLRPNDDKAGGGKADKTQIVEPGERRLGPGGREPRTRIRTPLINPIESAPRRAFTPIDAPSSGTSPIFTPADAPARSATPALTSDPSVVAPPSALTPLDTPTTRALTPIQTAPSVPMSPVATPIQTAPTVPMSPAITPIQIAPTVPMSPALTPIQTAPTVPTAPLVTPIQIAPTITPTPPPIAPITPITPLAPLAPRRY